MKNTNINRLSLEKKKLLEEKFKLKSHSSSNLASMNVGKDGKERLNTARDKEYISDIPLAAKSSKDVSQRSSMVSKSPDRGKYYNNKSNRGSDIVKPAETSRTSRPATSHTHKDKEHKESAKDHANKVKDDVLDVVNRKCQLLNDKLLYYTHRRNAM